MYNDARNHTSRALDMSYQYPYFPQQQYVAGSSLQNPGLPQQGYQGQPLFSASVPQQQPQQQHYVQSLPSMIQQPNSPMPQVHHQNTTVPYMMTLPSSNQQHLSSAFVHSQHVQAANKYTYQTHLTNQPQVPVAVPVMKQKVVPTSMVSQERFAQNHSIISSVPQIFKESTTKPHSKALPIINPNTGEACSPTEPSKPQSKALPIIDPNTGENVSGAGANSKPKLNPSGSSQLTSPTFTPSKSSNYPLTKGVTCSTTSSISPVKSAEPLNVSADLGSATAMSTVSPLAQPQKRRHETNRALKDVPIVSSAKKAVNPVDQEMEDIYRKFASILEAEGPLEPTSQKILGQFIKLSTNERKKVMTQGSIKEFLLNCDYIELQDNRLALIDKEQEISAEEYTSLEEEKAGDEFYDAVDNQEEGNQLQKFEDQMWKHGIVVEDSKKKQSSPAVMKLESIIDELSLMSGEDAGRCGTPNDQGDVGSNMQQTSQKRDAVQLEKLVDYSLKYAKEETVEKSRYCDKESLSLMQQSNPNLSSEGSKPASVHDSIECNNNYSEQPKNWSSGWSAFSGVKTGLKNESDLNLLQASGSSQFNSVGFNHNESDNATKRRLSSETKPNLDSKTVPNAVGIAGIGGFTGFNHNESDNATKRRLSSETKPNLDSKTVPNAVGIAGIGGFTLSGANRNNSNGNMISNFTPILSPPQFIPNVNVSPNCAVISPLNKSLPDVQKFNIAAQVFKPKKNLTTDFVENKDHLSNAHIASVWVSEVKQNALEKVQLQYIPPTPPRQTELDSSLQQSSQLKASSPEFKPKGFILSKDATTLKQLKQIKAETCTQGTNTKKRAVKETGVQNSVAAYDTCINTTESIFDPESEYNIPIVHTKDAGTDTPLRDTFERNTQTGRAGKHFIKEKSSQTDLTSDQCVEGDGDGLFKAVEKTDRSTDIEFAAFQVLKQKAVSDLRYIWMGVLEEIKLLTEVALLSKKEKTKLLEELNSTKKEMEEEIQRVSQEYDKLMKEIKDGKQVCREDHDIPYIVPSIPRVMSQLNQEARSQMDVLTAILDALPPEENCKIKDLIDQMVSCKKIVQIPPSGKTSTYYKKNFLEMEYMNAQYRLRVKFIAIYENYVLLTEREDKCLSCSERHPLMRDFDRVSSSYKASQKSLKATYENNLKQVEEGVGLKDLPPMTFRLPACPSTFIIPFEVTTSEVDDVYECLYENLASQMDKDFPPKEKSEEPEKNIDEILQEFTEIDNKKPPTKTKKKAKKKRSKSAHRDMVGEERRSSTPDVKSTAEVQSELEETEKSTEKDDGQEEKQIEVPSSWEDRLYEKNSTEENKNTADSIAKEPESQETKSGETARSENSTPGIPSRSQSSTPGISIGNSTPSLPSRSQSSTPGISSRSENSTPGLTSRSENSTPGYSSSSSSQGNPSVPESNQLLADQAMIMQQYQPLLNSMMMSLMQSNPALMFNPQLLQSMALQHLMMMLNNKDNMANPVGMATSATAMQPNFGFPNFYGNMLGQGMFPGVNMAMPEMNVLNPINSLGPTTTTTAAATQKTDNSQTVKETASSNIENKPTESSESKKSDKRVARSLPPGLSIERDDVENAADSDEMVPVGKKTRSNSVSEAPEDIAAILNKATKKNTSKVVKVKKSQKEKSGKKVTTPTKLPTKMPNVLTTKASGTTSPLITEEFHPAMNVGDLNFSGLDSSVPFMGNKPDFPLTNGAGDASRLEIPSKPAVSSNTEVVGTKAEPSVRPRTMSFRERRGSVSSISSVDSWDMAPTSRKGWQPSRQADSSSRSSPFESAYSSPRERSSTPRERSSTPRERSMSSNADSNSRKNTAGGSEDWNEEADPYAEAFKLKTYDTHVRVIKKTPDEAPSNNANLPVGMPVPSQKYIPPRLQQAKSLPTSQQPNVWSKPLVTSETGYMSSQQNSGPPARQQIPSNKMPPRQRAISDGNPGFNITRSAAGKALPIVASSIRTVRVNVVKQDQMSRDKAPVPITPLMSLDIKQKNTNADSTNPFYSLGKAPKQITNPAHVAKESAYKEKTKVSEISLIEPIDDKKNGESNEQTEQEAWQQVAGKRSRKNSSSGPNINLTGRKMVSVVDKPQDTTPAESKSTNFEKLISKMSASDKFANIDRQEVIQLINEVRTAKGSLKGMSMADIINNAEVIHNANTKKKVAVHTHIAPDGRIDLTKSRLYKTVICEMWKNGSCKKTSQDCVYAHGKEELQEGPKDILCPALKKGEVCQYGEKCMYSHSKAETESFRTQLSMKKTNSFDFASAVKPLHTKPQRPYDVVNSDEEPDAEQCSICLELIRTGYGNRLECYHVFHDACIKDWINKRQMTCPICRNHSLLREDFPKLGS